MDLKANKNKYLQFCNNEVLSCLTLDILAAFVDLGVRSLTLKLEIPQLQLVSILEGASVRLVHPRTWFRPRVAICFATDRSKPVTPGFLLFYNCL
jgi:hypothetical protein